MKIRTQKIHLSACIYAHVICCVVVLVLNVPPTAKVIWRRGHGLKSHHVICNYGPSPHLLGMPGDSRNNEQGNDLLEFPTVPGSYCYANIPPINLNFIKSRA